MVASTISISMEKIIKDNEELLEKFKTNNKSFDFYPGDFVKCTYFSQNIPFKVRTYSRDCIEITSLDGKESYLVSAEFLEKLDLDPFCVDLLYK
jgi:hypothetical protein